ncbi:hypothetical protein CHARACLAT_006027 [Characodon lateralis]|uniref:TNFR-Cys domain-containing protein n=1 Tax=Characodon lateralis TaxID=208331 RepID=A0ABU7E7F4_9TELE|nr:hypothetical protein [Characodon lateralis]
MLCSATHTGEAMKDILLLVVLLTVQPDKFHSLPYQPDSDGNCRNSTTEYLNDDTNLCCRKCPPGHRLTEECSGTSDTHCAPCGSDQYIENWNFSPNCLSCSKCKEKKGLTYAQECTPTRNSKCVCGSGMFCQMGFDDPYCTDCRRYTDCKIGFKVSVPGTRNSDVKCERCLTNPCQDRTTTVMAPVTVNSYSTTPHGGERSTQSISPYFPSMGVKTSETGQPIGEMVAVIGGVAGLLLFFIVAIVLLIFCKQKWSRGSGNFPPKVDANGNCETADNNGHDNSGDSQMISFTFTSPEQVCLLEKGDVTSDQSLSSSDSETITRADGFSSHESLRPLQPTIGLENRTSVLSEPMPLQSITDPITPLPSISTQSSSQPTSPLIVSPITNSPHVNVNITLHIGNGSCGTPSFQPTDFNQAECKLPFGQEEESISSPQQEAGKLSFMSVQETPSYCR